jgi:hypothetical protein
MKVIGPHHVLTSIGPIKRMVLMELKAEADQNALDPVAKGQVLASSEKRTLVLRSSFP